MSRSKIETNTEIHAEQKNDAVALATTEAETVEVLYQRLGAKWYAFSVVNDEVYAGAIPDEVITDAQNELLKGSN